MALYAASQGPATAAVRAQLADPTAQQAEARLTRLAAAFDAALTHALERLTSVPHETLRWLESIDPAKPAPRPFREKEHASLIDRYRMYWQRYLCYYVRAHRLGRASTEAQHGVQFTDRQWDALSDVIEALDDAVNDAIDGAVDSIVNGTADDKEEGV